MLPPKNPSNIINEDECDPFADVVSSIVDMPIPSLNELTRRLAELGIAASFSQYIPELQDETTPPESSVTTSPAGQDNPNDPEY